MIKASSLIKRIFLVLIALLSLLSLFLLFDLYQPISKVKVKRALGVEASDIYDNNFSFRDLNKNGYLDIYEDYRIASNIRADDLLSKMTLEEKVGQMFHPPFTLNPDIFMLLYEIAIRGNKSTEAKIVFDHITHFNLYGNPTPKNLAKQINYFQKIASKTRLGIPISISSDPIHEVPKGGGIASFSVDGFSKWPSQLGFAATNDPKVIYEFAQIARKEYLAVGIRTALHPMSDLATEPRWARNFGTFGSNADLASKMTLAYMDGFQGKKITNKSVHTMVKHFPGGGPQEDGLDPHLYSGRNQTYPGNNFNYHLVPFKKAIDNNLKVIMPYYGIPMGISDDEVAIGFNSYILTDLLRDELGFDGVICSDWGIISGRHWGVENLSIKERYKKSFLAGIDQYGGEDDPEHIIKLVNDGEISVTDINNSVKRILINKFDLGLFEDPYVNVNNVEKIVATDEHNQAGLDAQRKSIVLLENDGLLPLKSESKVFIDGLDIKIGSKFGNVTKSHKDADVVIMYVHTVFNGNQESGINRLFDNFLSTLFPNGNLNFNDEIKNKIKKYSENKKLILVVDLNRPAILSEIKSNASALIGTFGVLDQVIYEAIYGNFNPNGKLPFEIPSSMEEVISQKEDLPDDTENPTYVFGYGLSY